MTVQSFLNQALDLDEQIDRKWEQLESLSRPFPPIPSYSLLFPCIPLKFGCIPVVKVI